MKKKEVTIKQLSEEFETMSAFCRTYGLDRASAHNWVNLKNLPSAKVMVEIFEKSKGRCTYQKMIETFVKGE